MNNYNRNNSNYDNITENNSNNHKDHHYCEKCNYQTNKYYLYNKHLESIQHKTCKGREKTNNKKYKCEICEYENYNKNKYLGHLLNKHCTKDERKEKCYYYCKYCDVAVPVDLMLENHFKSKKHLLNIYELKEKETFPIDNNTYIDYDNYIYEINIGRR